MTFMFLASESRTNTIISKAAKGAWVIFKVVA
jgi:hypothetical protein